MQKNVLLTISILVLLATLLIVSCSAPTKTLTPAPSPVPDSATSSPEKPLELKFSHFTPPITLYHKDIFVPWAKEIEERSNGRLKITIFPGEALGKIQDQYNMVQSGQCDIALVDLSVLTGVFPLSDMISLPMIFDSVEQANATWWELTEKYLMDTEFKRVKLLWHNCPGFLNISTNTKPIYTLEDFPGVKIGFPSESCLKPLEKLGATPVFFPITEMYTSLERGLLDGTLLAWEPFYSFKMMEVTKYRTACYLDTATLSVFMNLDTWNSFPPDIKQLIDETGGLSASLKAGRVFDAGEMKAAETIMEYDRSEGNPEIYYLPEEEKMRWYDTIKPIYEESIAEKEAKGLPARAFFNDMLEIAAKYKK